jgi:plasmid stability protein
MATLTIRNLSSSTIDSLKELARRHRRSMEQEVREILELHAGDRLSAIEQIEQAWASQSRKTSPEEVESWIGEGRP